MTFKDLTNKEGYEYESLEVETEDGCILQMERIPNRNSYKAVYF